MFCLRWSPMVLLAIVGCAADHPRPAPGAGPSAAPSHVAAPEDAAPEEGDEIFDTAERMDADVLDLLATARRVEVLRIDPNARGPGGFQGYAVVDRADVAAKDRAGLRALMEELPNPGGPIVRCFDPRHAVRVEGADGTTVDLLICFECLQLNVVRGKRTTRVIIAGELRQRADELFAALGAADARPAED